MKIKVKKVKSEEEIKRFRRFWDEQKDHYTDLEESNNNFFSLPLYIIYTENKSELISMLFIYVRTIKYLNQEYKLGGIGVVATHRAYCRKGISSRLLKKAFEIMKVIKIDVSLLCTNIDKLNNLYNTVGFVPLEKPYYFEDRLGKLQKERGGMIAPVNSPVIIDIILNSDERLFVGKSNF